jgi:hypothetical protein
MKSLAGDAFGHREEIRAEIVDFARKDSAQRQPSARSHCANQILGACPENIRMDIREHQSRLSAC